MQQNNKKQRLTLILLLICLGLSIFLSARFGAVNISAEEISSALKGFKNGSDQLGLNERIFLQIRLPRVLLCLTVGASLSVGGVIMQALFRNPIIEPGLIGTSSGAAFGASLYFVLGALLKFDAGEWTLPLAACMGALLSTVMVLLLSYSKQQLKTGIVLLLLTGIAVNALFMSGVGFLSYIARDPQARSITFWGLGTLSGASWRAVIITGISSLICITISLRYSKHLNALMIGEEQAQLLGVNVKKLKLCMIILNVIMIAVATAFVGVISFIGLIVPHLLRMINGADNRYLIRDGAIAGSILLTLSDLLARMLFRPAELPIGIVTSIIGVPVFIILLRKKNYFF